jgi:hypothetical protein
MRTLNDIHSITAASHDQYAVTWLNPGPVTRGSDACWYATGNKAREIKRNVLIDHDDRRMIHHSEFSKRTDHAEGSDRNSFSVTPSVSAVELRPLRDARAFST